MHGTRVLVVSRVWETLQKGNLYYHRAIYSGAAAEIPLRNPYLDSCVVMQNQQSAIRDCLGDFASELQRKRSVNWSELIHEAGIFFSFFFIEKVKSFGAENVTLPVVKF